MSHDTENHCGYLIILDLAKSSFVNTDLRQNLAETKVLTLRLDLSLRPLLSLRPFVNTSPDPLLYVCITTVMEYRAFILQHTHT